MIHCIVDQRNGQRDGGSLQGARFGLFGAVVTVLENGSAEGVHPSNELTAEGEVDNVLMPVKSETADC